ncbi:MAG: M15 family metallopeptidase [Bacteroidetes bacterium]|jgi:peptidoglycan L-alanyl-D-glutamate endopeptidase CwlK|nr:M15 family metallopeptidase [Bacteroidota bacterium]
MALKLGHKGPEVKRIQELLNLHGASPKLLEDGDFGPRTQAALREFQAGHFDRFGTGLAVDGIAGNETIWALSQLIQPVAPAAVQPDALSLQRLASLHPKLRQEALALYHEVCRRGLHIRITAALRSFQEQDRLYQQGRTAPGPRVTNAKAGQSYHNFGLAIDFCLLLPSGQVSWDRHADLDHNGQADWEEMVFVFKDAGWAWGGDWTSIKDYPHFEKTFGLSTAQLRALHAAGTCDHDGYVLI